MGLVARPVAMMMTMMVHTHDGGVATVTLLHTWTKMRMMRQLMILMVHEMLVC